MWITSAKYRFPRKDSTKKQKEIINKNYHNTSINNIHTILLRNFRKVCQILFFVSTKCRIIKMGNTLTVKFCLFLSTLVILRLKIRHKISSFQAHMLKRRQTFLLTLLEIQSPLTKNCTLQLYTY